MDEETRARIRQIFEGVSDDVIILEALYHYREMLDEGVLEALAGVDVESEFGLEAVDEALDVARRRVGDVIQEYES